MLHHNEPAKRYGPVALGAATAARPDDDLLAAVKRYEILDTPPEPAFDRITSLAADLFDAPISVIGIVDRDGLWFKSHHGLSATKVRWDRGRDAPLAVFDSWILHEFKHGFHVGVPLRTRSGQDLGTLSVIDRRPRRVNDRQLGHLKSLAAVVMDQLELRLAKRRAVRMEVLTSEVDHRVMNSLQFVGSLLHLQSRALHGTETARQLTIAANRVSAVARVHRNFSANEVADRVPVLAYLRRLCDELSSILAANIAIEGVEKSVSTTKIMAIGLIVNELVTNARKHGAGPIKVVFTSGSAGQHELCVLDEGAGLPEGFAIDQPGGGLGMTVVAALARQLDGQLYASSNPAGRGACFMVSFPIYEHDIEIERQCVI